MNKLLLILMLIAPIAWADTPPDPTDEQLDKLMNYCPEDAKDNTKVKNCIAVNHEARIDELEAASSGAVYPLPAVCIAPAYEQQIEIINGWARVFTSQGTPNGGVWIQVMETWRFDPTNRINVWGTSGDLRTISPQFSFTADAFVCADALIPLLGPGVTIRVITP